MIRSISIKTRRNRFCFLRLFCLLLLLPLAPCKGVSGGSSSGLTVLFSFNGQNGATSKGTLTLGKNVLYGRTAIGGAANNGVIFKINTDGTGSQLLYSFTAGAANGSGNQPHHDAMLLDGATLYGAALSGGNTNNGSANGNGVIFKINTDGSGYQELHVFDGGTGDGSNSHSCFLLIGTTLYGMSALGGANNEGTIYKINTDGSGFQLLSSFAKSTGSQPHGRLILSQDGSKLLGMTRKGGASDFGVVFSFDLSSSSYQVLHTFTGGSGDGATTDHGYLVDLNGVLYGMTTNGGKEDKGVVFSMNEDGSNFQLLHHFSDGSGDGEEPYGSLLLSGDHLYGMTRKGGSHDEGTVFRIKTDGSAYESFASFHGKDNGAYPIDNVVVSEDGSTLYGLTQAGGANDPGMVYQYGTIFSLPVP